MINYQGQMYGVFKQFRGGDNGYGCQTTNKIDVSVNIDMDKVLNTVLEYIDKKINHDNKPKEVEKELVEAIYFE